MYIYTLWYKTILNKAVNISIKTLTFKSNGLRH